MNASLADAAAPVAAVPSRPVAPPAVPGAWPLWQCVAFRYALVFFVLYAFPSPLSRLLQTLSDGYAWLGQTLGLPWLADAPFRWPGAVATYVSDVVDGRWQGNEFVPGWWQHLTTWMAASGLAPYDVIHQRTGSGDTGHDFARLLAIAATAAVVAGVWSLLHLLLNRRATGYPRLGRWFHLVARFYLAFDVLGYGVSKLYGGQFGELSLERLTQEIGDTWPMSMVGTFMQSSKPYELFGGGAEVLAALLLFHRRTALLGALTTIGVMTNVGALNWLCGVPVKLYSAWLLVCAFCLLAPWCRPLWALFVGNRAAPAPVDLTVPSPAWARWPLQIVGWGWVTASLFLSHTNGTAPRPWLQGREKSALYGVWTVDRMVVDGKDVPVADATRWRFFAVDRGKRAWARDATGRSVPFEFVLDAAAGSAQVKTLGGAPGAMPSPWTCEQGTKTAPCDPPLLLRNADRNKKVDGELRTLVLKGRWGERQLELYTVEKRFRLLAGFRLRQELPDFW